MKLPQHQEEFPETPFEAFAQIAAEHNIDRIDAITIWLDLWEVCKRHVAISGMDGDAGILFDQDHGRYFVCRGTVD